MGRSLWKYKRLATENHKFLSNQFLKNYVNWNAKKLKNIINENLICGLWELDMKTNLLSPLWKMIENFFLKNDW